MVTDVDSEEITMDEWQAEMERQLEVAARNHQRSRWPWSEWETRTLHKFYGRVPVPVLAEKLGRTIAAVHSAAQRENIKVRMEE